MQKKSLGGGGGSGPLGGIWERGLDGSKVGVMWDM